MKRTLPVGRRFYAAPPGQVRVRRATDIVGLGAFALALAGIVAAQPAGPFERSLLNFLETFPDWLRPVWAFLIACSSCGRGSCSSRRWCRAGRRITLEAVLAVVLAIVVGLVAARIAPGAGPAARPRRAWTTRSLPLRAGSPSAAAVIGVVNGHVSRPSPRPAGGCWHSERRRGHLRAGDDQRGRGRDPDRADRRERRCVSRWGRRQAGPASRTSLRELEALDEPAHDLQEADRQVAGVLLVYGKDSSGGDLAIKVYGRDAYDNQRLARAWRALWYRDPGSMGLSRARPAEREALFTLFARNAGAPVSEVLTAGITAGGDTLIVLRAFGPPARTVRGRRGRRRAPRPLLGGTRSARAGPRRPSRDQSLVASRRRTARSRSSISAGASSHSTTTSASPTARSCWRRPQRGRFGARGRGGGDRDRHRGNQRAACRTSSRRPSPGRCAGPSRSPRSTSTTFARPRRRRPGRPSPSSPACRA